MASIVQTLLNFLFHLVINLKFVRRRKCNDKESKNNESITYDVITMTYGLKTGPSPAAWNYAKETGGTLITITGKNKNQSVDIEHIVINEDNV